MMGSIQNFIRSPTTLLILSLIVWTTSPLVVEARVHHHKWEVKYQFKSPDCFQKLAVTINGMTPGPTIYARQGDTVVVEVKNSLFTENVAIHWHGIRQIGTPWSDGTEGVTQCPIVPGDTFTYKFVVDRAGTYIYHAHYGMQRSAGLNGMIIVSVPDGVTEPFSYDYDRSILLNDWWHKSTYEQAAGLNSVPFVWIGEPQGHSMTIVEADGNYVEPFVVKNLNIYSGETYSVIVKADQDSSRNYWAALNVITRKPGTPTGLGIINYYPNSPKKSPPTVPPSGPIWNDTTYFLRQSQAIKARQGYVIPPPPTSDRVITLLNTQNKIDGRIKWALNNMSFTLPDTPYLVALKQRLHHVFNQKPAPETYDSKNFDVFGVAKNANATSGNSIYRLKFNSTVDIILQNANTMTVNNSETHPWHLHGHDFWVLGHGIGKFDPMNDPKKYNLVDPIMKNTVPLHRYGWTALRFRADNPGVWAFHCHIEAHFFMGMGVVFEEGVEKVGRLPSSIMGCGETKRFLRH
ncbi:L-ascorbate oxidase [Acorus calamus]|uniref:L-ascorbate oxidase n=1 Tax=Acorus calamus TaxID=4465 RepID=A0AAV9DM79_ACOCL|nr:L-ascorbate oxidase [Acorus calamus]